MTTENVVLMCGGESVVRLKVTSYVEDPYTNWNNYGSLEPIKVEATVDLIDGTTVRLVSTKVDVHKGNRGPIPQMVEASAVETLQDENDILMDENDDLKHALKVALDFVPAKVKKQITTTLGEGWDE